MRKSRKLKRKHTIEYLALVLGFVALIIALVINRSNFSYDNRSGAVGSADQLVSYFGDGELQDITIIPSVEILQSQPVTKFTVSGSRVSQYSALNGKHYYYYQSGSSTFSPLLQTTDFTLTKQNDTFVGTITNLRSGCIDFFASTTYISSICVSPSWSPAGSAPELSLYYPDTRLPYRYVNGKYEWNYSRPEGWLSGVRTNTSYMYATVSSTLPFDKNTHPYYQNSGNFVPSNYYWTDSVTDPTYDFIALTNIYITSMPNLDVTCSSNQAILSIFSTLPNTQPKVSYNVINTPWATGGCVFYTYPETHPMANFSVVRNSYITLMPIPVVTPMPTPTPTSVPEVTPMPTPTPTSVPQLSLATIYAAGTAFQSIYPNMKLELNGSVVGSWTNIRGNAFKAQYEKYTLTLPTKVKAGDSLRIYYTNDTFTKGTTGRNLRVDKIEVDGKTYQSESPTTYSTGTYSRGRCSPQYALSEWLHCNGYFQYQIN